MADQIKHRKRLSYGIKSFGHEDMVDLEEFITFLETEKNRFTTSKKYQKYDSFKLHFYIESSDPYDDDPYCNVTFNIYGERPETEKEAKLRIKYEEARQEGYRKQDIHKLKVLLAQYGIPEGVVVPEEFDTKGMKTLRKRLEDTEKRLEESNSKLRKLQTLLNNT
jgi:hypothetical protein